jgi:hypothetical protein
MNVPYSKSCAIKVDDPNISLSAVRSNEKMVCLEKLKSSFSNGTNIGVSVIIIICAFANIFYQSYSGVKKFNKYMSVQHPIDLSWYNNMKEIDEKKIQMDTESRRRSNRGLKVDYNFV